MLLSFVSAVLLSAVPRCDVESWPGCCQTCHYPYLKTIGSVKRSLVVDAVDFVSRLDSVAIGSGLGPLEFQEYTIVNTRKLNFRRVNTPCHVCVTLGECLSNGTIVGVSEFVDECYFFRECYNI